MATGWLSTHWVLYMSRARTAQVPATLLHIIRSAERRNVRLDVTGLLAYGDGLYLQYLQGPGGPLRGLYSHIAQDFRHRILWTAQGLVGRNRIAPGFPLGYFEIGAEVAIPTAGPGDPGPGAAPALIAALLDAAAEKYPSAVAPDLAAGPAPARHPAPASKR